MASAAKEYNIGQHYEFRKITLKNAAKMKKQSHKKSLKQTKKASTYNVKFFGRTKKTFAKSLVYNDPFGPILEGAIS